MAEPRPGRRLVAGIVPALWTEGTSAAKRAEDIQVILTEGIPPPDEEQS